MKHNWEYKRLGDVCIVIGGSTPKTDVPEFWDGKNNWFTPAEINGTKYYSSSERKITDDAVKATGLTLMPAGTVLLTSRAPIGKLGILTKEAYCNQGFKNLVCKEGLYNEYLYYALIYLNEEIKDKGRGATFKEISKKITESIAIPVPPMKVQRRIVAELDGINAQIDRCRELLRTLDSLTTSLFYNTFGDPVTNPKGWEVNLMSSACKLVTDGTHFSPKSFPEGDYMYISAKNIKKNGLDLSNVTFVDAETHTSMYRTCPVKKGDILYIKDGATTGIAIINPIEEEFSLLSSVALLRANQRYICPIYLRDFLNCPTVYQLFRTRMGGAAITRLTLKKINSFKIPIPPLPLQKEFVAQIEAIEAQKAKVEATIKELQTLLDSRMDYWFN